MEKFKSTWSYSRYLKIVGQVKSRSLVDRRLVDLKKYEQYSISLRLHLNGRQVRNLRMLNCNPIEINRLKAEEAEQALFEKCGFAPSNGKFWSESYRLEDLRLIESSKAAIASSIELLSRHYGDYFPHT